MEGAALGHRAPELFSNACLGTPGWGVIVQIQVPARLWEPAEYGQCVRPQLYLILCDPILCSPPGSSVHGISQARILECVAISSSRGSS